MHENTVENSNSDDVIANFHANYKIRQFKPNDLQKITQINRTTLPENYPDSFFLLVYSSFPEGFLVIEDKTNHIIGYTMNRIETGLSNFSRLRRAKKGHIISIAILPVYRRMGYGKKLMEISLNEMIKLGASECFLEVRESNESAVKMYLNRGFEKIKILRRYYSDHENAFLMGIRL